MMILERGCGRLPCWIVCTTVVSEYRCFLVFRWQYYERKVRHNKEMTDTEFKGQKSRTDKYPKDGGIF